MDEEEGINFNEGYFMYTSIIVATTKGLIRIYSPTDAQCISSINNFKPGMIVKVNGFLLQHPSCFYFMIEENPIEHAHFSLIIDREKQV